MDAPWVVGQWYAMSQLRIFPFGETNNYHVRSDMPERPTSPKLDDCQARQFCWEKNSLQHMGGFGSFSVPSFAKCCKNGHQFSNEFSDAFPSSSAGWFAGGEMQPITPKLWTCEFGIHCQHRQKMKNSLNQQTEDSLSRMQTFQVLKMEQNCTL